MTTTELGRPHVSTQGGQPARARRGTSNRDARGSTYSRRQRRLWLVETYRADRSLYVLIWVDGSATGPESHVLTREQLIAYDGVKDAVEIPVCRCYRCGRLLHAGVDLPDGTKLEGTVTADRIKPGGSYRRENIRPACGPCNEYTGGKLGAERRKVGTS